MRELQELRFGKFVCWSFSIFSGKEWTPGVKDIALFQPSGCDTEQWVKAAKEFAFAAVTASAFRLNILNADEVPTICEFEVFAVKE